jgi:hypothetical protein
MSYGQRHELKIFSIENKIRTYYIEKGNLNDRNNLIKYINAPNDMEIIVDINNIEIDYKNIIYKFDLNGNNYYMEHKPRK